MRKFWGILAVIFGLFLLTYVSTLKNIPFLDARSPRPFETSDVLAAVILNATISESVVPNAGIVAVPPLPSSTPTEPVASATPVAPASPSTPTAPPTSEAPQALALPSHLSIPSIKVSAAIQPVGVDLDGKMSVPTTANTVGWYKNGTLPGETGSAVLDAHVYLAFKNLRKLKLGSDIYVTTKDGTRLRFVVATTRLYRYDQVPAEKLFESADGAHLNLITCAGTWLPGAQTYDERLVIYANLAD